ncbi:MAG: OFA family MFS transporter [Firmicutes bacterium]|nr:OFA family MFS transporter [Bacillota bacterium]
MEALGKIKRAWLVTAAGTLINFFLGVCYTWSLFARNLVEESGWSQAEAALPYTLLTICYSLFMVPAGSFQDKLGARRITTLGAIFAGTAFLLGSFATTPLLMAFFFGFFYGVGIACCYVSLTPAAIKWFSTEKSGLISGIVVSGTGASALIASPLVNILLQHYEVHNTMRLLGVIVFGACIVLAQFVAEPEQKIRYNLADNPSRKEDDSVQLTEYNYKEMLKTGQFYQLWLMLCLSAGTGLMFIAHLDSIVLHLLSIPVGFIMVSLFSLSNALGRLIAGALADRLGSIKAMTLVFLLMCMAWVLLLVPSSMLTVSAATLIAGFCYGGIYGVFPATIVNYYGLKNFGLNFGLLFTAISVAALLGPYFGGLLFDLVDSYSILFAVPLLFCLLVAFLSWRLSGTGGRFSCPAEKRGKMSS